LKFPNDNSNSIHMKPNKTLHTLAWAVPCRFCHSMEYSCHSCWYSLYNAGL